MSSYIPTLIRMPVNERGRDFFIGDLHGCTAHLLAALKAVRFREDRDRLFSVGDLIDHGPDSWGAITLLREKPWFHAVLGNHEALALATFGRMRSWSFPDELWMHNGGQWVVELDEARRQSLIETLLALPIAIEVPLGDGRRVGLIHAEITDRRGWPALSALTADGLRADDDLSDRLEAGLLWSRRQAAMNTFVIRQAEFSDLSRLPSLLNAGARRRQVDLTRRTPGIDLLISGHSITHHHQPFAFENRLSIDTGAYRHDGALTIAEPLANRYYEVHWRRDGHGPVQKATRHALPAPVRAWHLRALLRAKALAGEHSP